MTSATGTDGHPEVSEISELTEGLLSPSRATEVRDHLATCALCEDVYASLEEIRGVLGTLPGPERMPADVASRIDAALAAEALLDATTPDGGDLVSRETSATSASATASTPASVSRETEAAPPARGATSTRPAGRPRGASGPGRQPAGGRTARSRRWPRILLGTAAAAAVFSFGGFLIQNSVTDSGDGGQDHPAAAQNGPSSSTDITAANLGTHVQKLLAGKGSHKSPEIGTRSSPETPLRGGTDTVPSCVQKGIGRTEAPLASSQRTYEGKAAYLVVLPDASDTSRVTAYVVASSCVSATPPAPGEVLLTHSYRRD